MVGVKKSLGILVVIVWAIVGLLSFAITYGVEAHDESEDVTVYMFGRDDCSFCLAEKLYFEGLVERDPHVSFEYLNVLTEDESARLFGEVARKHGISLVTPTTVIGPVVLQGFNGAETTGKKIESAIAITRQSDIKTINDHIERAPEQDGITIDGACDPDHGGISCDVTLTGVVGSGYEFDLPFIGVVDLQSFSLFSLAAVLGTVDGFNPCAMWVLITFLVLLSQVGDRKKMILVAGIFILAEAIMYNLILNVWFTAWDFVALDHIVTPLVGGLAMGGGLFFLYRYVKNRNQPLICDITDLEQQGKTESRIRKLISQPVTLATLASVIVIAFSVNIIEFACSIGIPQAFTKILEINQLSFFEAQWYVLIYTIGYMIDDLVVFGLAIWGFSKLQSHGHKYSQLSLVIGGVLMLVLGAVLIFDPSLLVL